MIVWESGDAENVALCVWKEARGEGQLGMKAVMDVILNRAKDWNKSLHDVVYARNQFTSMSVPSDPEYNLQPQDGDPQYAFCLGLCQQEAAGNNTGDITQGAHYYCNEATEKSGWFKDNVIDSPSHPRTVKIGRQDFFV